MENISLDSYLYLRDYEDKNKDAGLKRVKEIKNLINAYNFVLISPKFNLRGIEKKLIGKGEFKQDVEYIVADKYFQNLSFFKKYIESEEGKTETNVNIYKIISGLELAICEVQPFYHEDFDVRKRINSHFGFFVGLGFLTGWYQTDFLHYTFPNLDNDENKELGKLINEHIDWLYILQSQFHLPYFSNAHTWWALKLLLDELNEKR